MTRPKSLCMLPWISIAANTVGTTRPCCISYDEITRPDGSTYNLATDHIEEIFHSDYMKDLRQQFLDGKKPANCQKCWDEEAVGRFSKRLNHYKKMGQSVHLVDFTTLEPKNIMYLDLKLGNICNLKCRICSPFTSSKRAQEILVQIDHKDRKTHPVKRLLKDGEWPRTTIMFWDDLKDILPKIKYLDFTGGEPFLIREHFDVLKQSVRRGYSRYQILYYNTNGTQLPIEVLELWPHFKKVEVSISVDSVGLRGELERHGASWTTVNDNIDTFCTWRDTMPNLEVHLCCTISIQNVLYLEELCAWAITKNFDYEYFNLVHDPDWMSIASMTKEARSLVIDKLASAVVPPKYAVEIDKIKQFIINGSSTDGVEFVTKMKELDRLRRENFAETHTEIAKAMGYDAA